MFTRSSPNYNTQDYKWKHCDLKRSIELPDDVCFVVGITV